MIRRGAVTSSISCVAAVRAPVASVPASRGPRPHSVTRRVVGGVHWAWRCYGSRAFAPPACRYAAHVSVMCESGDGRARNRLPRLPLAVCAGSNDKPANTARFHNVSALESVCPCEKKFYLAEVWEDRYVRGGEDVIGGFLQGCGN